MQQVPAPADEPQEWRPGEAPEVTADRVVKLAFGGDVRRYRRFLNALQNVLPDDASVILRGSAVTGRRWGDGLPFDADGPGTSDLDVTFVGGDMIRHWGSFYIPSLHTVPLSDEHPDACPAFVPLRATLCRLARRAVNLQATRSLMQFVRDVVMNQPYLTLVEKRAESASEAPGTDPAP